MKNYVQYHNTSKEGRLVIEPGTFRIRAKKSIQHLLGNRVWLISGEGLRSPKSYYLRYVFTVNEVTTLGPNNIAKGTTGHNFGFLKPLNPLGWFEDFRINQQNFRGGVCLIPDDFVAQIEELLMHR